jgi:hypothetical protein
LKLHVLAGYSPHDGRLAVAGAEVTGFEAHDAPIGGRLLVPGGGEPLLADRAYDSHRLRVRARRPGLTPNIRARADFCSNQAGGSPGIQLRQG